MSKFTRRKWLGGVGAAFLMSGASPKGSRAAPAQSKPKGKSSLDLSEFKPKSMLHVPETKLSRSRYPVIDIHTHISVPARDESGVEMGEEMKFFAEP
ncbi:MAG: hypothetical protein U0V70_19905, partial [Terriglobia bacterium]